MLKGWPLKNISVVRQCDCDEHLTGVHAAELKGQQPLEIITQGWLDCVIIAYYYNTI
jgi:hypothetical protein